MSQETYDLQEYKEGLPVRRRLPTWREMNMDTSPEAEELLFSLWRETPAWRKLELMEDMNRTVRQLALVGLRRRHPNASQEELRRRLADILLGEGLAAKVYGPIPQ
jgi:hypothetical protein